MINYYALLELPDFASEADIKAAHRRLSKKYHPDLNNGDKYSEEMFKKIQDAYERLRDPAFRTMYDNRLRGNNHYNYHDNDTSHQPGYTRQTPQTPSFGEALRKVPVFVWAMAVIWTVKLAYYTSPRADNVDNFHYGSSTDKDSILKLFENDSILMLALDAQPYDTGATFPEVRTMQGKPTLIERTPEGDEWFYGNSKILFRNGRVVAYDNRDGNLYVKDSAVGYK